MNRSVVATAAATGSGAAAVSVLVWILSLAHVTIPADVAASLVLLIGTGGHYLTTFLAVEKVLPMELVTGTNMTAIVGSASVAPIAAVVDPALQPHA